MWTLRVVDPPSQEPLSVDDIKAHCRIDYDDEDALLASYITAARQLIEEDLSRALITQTLELGLDDFPRTDRIRIPRGNLQEIVSVKYRDATEQQFTMTAGADYLVNQYAEPAEIVLPFGHVWPSVVLSTSSPVAIQFVSGWADAASVPGPIKHAMRMTIADWVENREDIVIGKTSAVATKLPNGVERLLASYRLYFYTPYMR
jgi:uncharacterized phiE125 gp8 family phage protein